MKQIDARLKALEQAMEVVSNLPTVKKEINDKAKEAIDEDKAKEKMLEDMAKEQEEKEAEEAIKNEQKRIEEQGTKDLVSKEEKKEIDKLHDEEEAKDAYESEQRAKIEKKIETKIGLPNFAKEGKADGRVPVENYGMGVEGPMKEEPLIKPETKNIKEYITNCYTCKKKIKITEEPKPNTVYRCKECMNV